MFNKMIRKVIVYCFVIIMILSVSSAFFSSKAQAAGFSDDIKSEFDTGAVDTDITKLANNSAITAISIMRIVGVSIAVVMLLAVSIKYMVSSAGDRADIKKHAVVYIVGAMVLFGAVGILGIIDDFTQKSLDYNP